MASDYFVDMLTIAVAASGHVVDVPLFSRAHRRSRFSMVLLHHIKYQHGNVHKIPTCRVPLRAYSSSFIREGQYAVAESYHIIGVEVHISMYCLKRTPAKPRAADL